MTDLMVPTKRPPAPSFSDMHPDYSEKEIGQAQVNNFLELCRFCKKNLRHDEDVFMYGHFGAFCTQKCRAKQMACDIFRGSSLKIAGAKKGRICGTKKKPKESKDEAFGGNRESNNTPPRFFI